MRWIGWDEMDWMGWEWQSKLDEMRMTIKIGNRNVKLNVKMLKCKMLKWNKKLFISAWKVKTSREPCFIGTQKPRNVHHNNKTKVVVGVYLSRKKRQVI